MTKREAVLDAAARLFLRHGFRKASMDEIARESGVSKPTLYAYFADKETLFAAVCDHVGQSMLSAAHSALAGQTFVERVYGILSAKFSATFELLRQSPHALELMETQQAAARTRIDDTTAKFDAMLVAEIERASRSREINLQALGLSKRELARVLMQAGHGAAYGASDVKEQQRQLLALLRTILRPFAP